MHMIFITCRIPLTKRLLGCTVCHRGVVNLSPTVLGMIVCTCMQVIFMSIGLVLLSAVIFGAWIWHPLYFDMEDVINAIKQKVENVKNTVEEWYNSKFNKDAEAPEQTRARQEDDFEEVSISTVAARKIIRQESTLSAGARMKLTKVQRQNNSSLLLARLKGVLPAPHPVCRMLHRLSQPRRIPTVTSCSNPSPSVHTRMHRHRGES